jgi:hypothetical protein
VRGEGLAAQHREEAQHAREHGHDAGRDPGVEHQAGEHAGSFRSAAAVAAFLRWLRRGRQA